jgi:hypothetical protein
VPNPDYRAMRDPVAALQERSLVIEAEERED